MDSNILAATIGVIGGFLASLLLFYLNRFYTNYDKRKSEKILREKLLGGVSKSMLKKSRLDFDKIEKCE